MSDTLSREEREQLGKRALAAGVPWMVGMRTTEGAIVVEVHEEDAGITVYSGDLMDAVGYAPYIAFAEMGQAVPDLTDPATLGAALVHVLSKVEGAQSIEGAARELVESLGGGVAR